MLSDFPRKYQVVRQGQVQDVSVASLGDLLRLRTELELIRRFGAGATRDLIGTLDRRLMATESRLRPAVLSRVESLREMRALLSDALEPKNAQALRQIDRDCPELRARLNMDSITKDSKAFRADVVAEINASGEEDVDAMLAAFEEATRETAGDASTSAPADLDSATIDAMLAEVADASDFAPVDPVEAAMAELAQSAAEPETVQPADVETELPVDQPQPPMMAEDVVAESDLDPISGIETATERVAESLINAEQQLDAIASAFETAASELDTVTADVVASTPVMPEPPSGCADIPTGVPAAEVAQEDAAAMAAWNADPDPGATLNPTYTTSSEPVTLTSTTPAATPFVAPIPPAVPGGLRAQLQQARANMLAQLDDLLVVIERAERMQSDADAAMRRAQEFERAAAQAREAAQMLAAAEAESAKAQAAFEQAQARVQAARDAWSTAQQQASSVAAKTPRPS